MQSTKAEDIIARLHKGESLEACETGGAYEIAFDPQFPYICAAIHNGHRFASELRPLCLLDEAERLYEEDPHTGDLISGYPNRIIAFDSRYEYDLNRNELDCIYQTAWGKKIWSRELPEELSHRSIEKHRAFYKVFDAAVQALIKKHGFCVVYDVHSYNGERKGGTAAPSFNIGTAQIDMRKHRSNVNFMLRQLDRISITGETVRAAHDEVFLGQGYLATRVRELSSKALCLPIEIRKFYCEEQTATLYPQIFNELKDGFTKVIVEHAAFFANKRTEKSTVHRHDMLSSQIEPVTRQVDRDLFRIAKSMETLLYVNPINIDQERKRFFARKERYEPVFKYRKLDIDPFLVKEKLFRLPIEEISDVTVQTLYRRAIDGLSTKVDLLSAIGSKGCLYNSLRYYGEPDRADLDNARFLLHAPELKDEIEDRDFVSDMAVAELLQKEIDYYTLDAPVKLSSRLVAGAMVDNANFRVLVKRGSHMTRKAAQALKHHEVGVHLLTSANARQQPLSLFRLGLPGSTETQEGIAVLAEYLSGNMSLKRLKVLALRVIAVRYLLDGHSFERTYSMLMEEYPEMDDHIFMTVVRVFRGGGFTKDYLYLRGLAKAYFYWQSGKSWEPLLIGKSAFDDSERIQELIERSVIVRPERLPHAFTMKEVKNPIHDYLLSSLKYEMSDEVVAA
ncbi:flavohemoglobin expression-modulating QEGLA motif protein [Terasakiella sp.]|uniref:flavohemoglobin expression-modulating QEGLA motif protein n=1 Tax=Terasakiella sp. TaxID=2034861 RepID=UPI003AA8ED82